MKNSVFEGLALQGVLVFSGLPDENATMDVNFFCGFRLKF